MSAEVEWARMKELVKVESLSAPQGEEMRDLALRLLCTPEGRERIETGLHERFDGKTKAISKLVNALDKLQGDSRIPQAELTRLLHSISAASVPHKEKTPYWTVLWMRLVAGDPRISKAILEAMGLNKGTGSSGSAIHRLIQLDSWKNIPKHRRSDLLEAALKAESRPDVRMQLQAVLDSNLPVPRSSLLEAAPKAEPRPDVRRQPEEVLHSNLPDPRSSEVRSGPGPTEDRPVAPTRDGAKMSSPPSPENPSVALADIPPQRPPTLEPPGSSLTSSATRAMDAPLPGAPASAAASHDLPREEVHSMSVGGDQTPSDDRLAVATNENGLKTEPARDDTLPEEKETRKKPRPRGRAASDEPGSPLDIGDPAQRVADLLANYLPRLDDRLAALTGEVRDVGRRLPAPDERRSELASLRDELRRVQDALRERQRLLDEALLERDRLKDAAENASAKIRVGEERARAAEARADQHIHQAERDRENAVQNYLAGLRPDLRRLLIDIGDHAQDEEAVPQTETEGLLWQRLRDIKQALRNHGVLHE
jgi:hypothetical protein